MSQSVDRALTVLASLADGPTSLDQAAKRLGVHKSTAMRLLHTLEEHGFAHRQDDHRYRLGGRLFSLAQSALEGFDVRRVASPYLVALNERYGHTVHLAVLEDGEVIHVDKVESRYPVPPHCWLGGASRIGRPAAPTAAASAKVLLADLPEEQRRERVAALDFPAHTSRSIRSPEEYLAELDAVREQGWARDLGEVDETVNAVAVPIRGVGDRAIAACSISAPAAPPAGPDGLPPVLADLLPELLCTAEAISLAYGGRPTLRWCESRCGARPGARASRT
ncbi:IclR family transcriptional regulator [Peterkaempfera bronchialis]|uniref:IclR family transcriptional regulator n=1 Tax=Peterkaempfera bronchialis TaxID=2126346 RepID=A0A345T0P4_9ACTN|nr:IclR family transcriptional regulator [Peterkaempfera bronchialis]AXI79549.1 IclR family transcriptional regulator [Peterkaempfera bronchialis]